MKKVQKNDTITITYVGKLTNGEIFKTITKEAPLTVQLGQSDLPPTVNNGIVGMEVGQTKKIVVEPDEAYGPRQKNLLQTIRNKEIIDKINPRPGMIITFNAEKDGKQHPVPATIMEVKDGEIVVDYNHPLAGHTLTFEITVLSIS